MENNLKITKPKPTTLEECLAPTLDAGGVDWSLMTGLDMMRFKQYGTLRKELSLKYPNSGPMEDEDDTLDVTAVADDPRASLFTKLLFLVHAAYERVDMLQNFATEYDKKLVRFYGHITLNWPAQSQTWFKMLEAHRIYEMVECYFKVLRKYGLSTTEEPYYFLTPDQKQKVKLAGNMLKRSTMIDENEIKLSILEELE